MQHVLVFPKLTQEQKNSHIQAILSKYIGNEVAKRRLARAAAVALDHPWHLCQRNFAFFGPPSVGKTTLAKKVAELLCLPFIDITSQISNVNELLERICFVLLNFEQKSPAFHCQKGCLDVKPIAEKKYKLPPCVIFIDEVHSLKKNMIDALLKATERNDAVLFSAEHDEINTQYVTWIIATTDRGNLPKAFDTRFTAINLESYSKDEIADIIRAHHPDLDLEVCRLVANYCPDVPREALDFVVEMKMEKNLSNEDWIRVASKIAQERGIDEYGMTKQRLEVLRILSEGPASLKRLANQLNCEEEEVRKFIMPPLLKIRNGLSPFVNVSTRGYFITEIGCAELAKRNIIYKNPSRWKLREN